MSAEKYSSKNESCEWDALTRNSSRSEMERGECEKNCPFNIHYRLSIFILLWALDSMRLATSAYNYLHFILYFFLFFFPFISASLLFPLYVASISERRSAANGNLLLSFDSYFHAIGSAGFSFPEFFHIMCIISMILDTKLRINDTQQRDKKNLFSIRVCNEQENRKMHTSFLFVFFLLLYFHSAGNGLWIL